MPIDLSQVTFSDPMNIREASLYLGVGEQRVRALHRAGTITADDTSGRLLFKKADLDTYKAQPRRTGGGGRVSANGKAFVVRIPADKMNDVQGFLSAQGIQLENRYNVEAQKRAQAKQRAKKLASKANPAPTEATAPISPEAPVPAGGNKRGLLGNRR